MGQRIARTEQASGNRVWRSRFRRWLAPGLAVVTPVLFFWRLAFTNLILARGDTLLYFYPYWDYRARALLAGRLPLWDPLLFMGAPFLANSQAGVLYPFNWPLAAFPAAVAVKLAILFHLALAAGGCFAFARRALGQGELAAWLSTLVFAAGGYLTAQVEHVNQLQGLAWLPWLLLGTHGLVHQLGRRDLHWRWSVVRMGVIVALQLLAGHTQSVFICLSGAAAYAVALVLATRSGAAIQKGSAGEWGYGSLPHSRTRILTYTLLALATAALLGGLLAAAQLLPTLELSGQSLRGGGLPLREALSFSLDPRLLGRALLPGYSRAVFSEFVAYGGLAALCLAGLGLRRRPEQMALLALCLLGLAFALGAYDPAYAALALVPPFSLFRAPARWLVLFALGLGLLAGSGLEALSAARPRGRQWAAFLPPLLLMALAPMARGVVAAGETGPLGLPATRDWLGWLGVLLALAALLWLVLPRAWRRLGIAAIATLELFAAGQALPYNTPTAPDAYASIRPAMTQLLAAACGGDRSQIPVDRVSCAGLEEAPAAPGRFLSLSALRFDPGDSAELHSALDRELPPAAVYDLIVATKHQEVLSPNLPLAWGVPAVDGYDGGILPLAHYAAFTQLFTGAASADGRLRENLSGVPDNRLLSLVNGRYLITDKVDDAWIDGVFYDLQFKLSLNPGESMEIAYVPEFQATALGVVADAPSGSATLTLDDGSTLDLPINAGRVPFPRPARPARVTLHGPLTVHGLSLIDERTGAFQTLTLGPYRLVHSGDVKVYENLAVLPRAWVAPNVTVMGDDDAARAALADPSFEPGQTVLLAEAPHELISAGRAGTATITAYTPERVRLTAEGPGTLVLTDAYYPGWAARIDGQDAAIYRADIMFRAVVLPPGGHTVELRFRPRSVYIGFAVSGLAWAGVMLALAARRRR